MMNPPATQQPPNEAFPNGQRNRALEIIGVALIEIPQSYMRPKPNIQALFRQFNARYFQGQLSAVKLEWTRKLIPNGGGCFFGKNKCTIKLSGPLMKLRTRQELMDILIHQMVHAYIFVKTRDKSLRHGPKFCKFVYRINKHAGYHISGIYGSKCEFDVFNSHWWQCDGPCKKWPKRYGYIKRKQNVAPGPLDSWWQRHQNMCGGRFKKVQEPSEGTEQNHTVAGSTAPPNASGNKRETGNGNLLADIPVGDTCNENTGADTNNSPQSNNATVVRRENSEQLRESVQNGEQDKQQNVTIVRKPDKKQQKKKKDKQKHAVLLKKKKSKQHHATMNKRDKLKHSTMASTEKKAPKQSTEVKGNADNSQQSVVATKETAKEMQIIGSKVEPGKCEHMNIAEQQVLATTHTLSVNTDSAAMKSIPADNNTHSKGIGNKMQPKYIDALSYALKKSKVNGGRVQKKSPYKYIKYMNTANCNRVSFKIQVRKDTATTLNICRCMEKPLIKTETTTNLNCGTSGGTSTEGETLTLINHGRETKFLDQGNSQSENSIFFNTGNVNNIQNEGILANKHKIESEDTTSDSQELVNSPLKKIKMEVDMTSSEVTNTVPQNMSTNSN